MTDFFPAIKTGYKRYSDFGGRSTRAEYWWWMFYMYLGTLALAVSGGLLMGEFGGLPLAIFWIINLIPFFAVITRRLHDSGKPGWWFLLAVIPFYKIFVFLPVFVVFTMLPSQKGMNKYGLQPSKIDRSVFEGPGLGKLLNLW